MLDFIETYYQFFFAGLAAVLYVFFLVRKVLSKQWLNKNLYKYFFFVLLIIPFWLLWLYNIGLFIAPNLETIYSPPENVQDIAITNLEKTAVDMLFIGREYKSNNWKCIYPNGFHLNKQPIQTIEPLKQKRYSFRSGKLDVDVIAVMLTNDQSYSEVNNGKAFKLPKLTIQLYSNEFDNKTNFVKPAISFKYEILLLVYSITGLFGFVYYTTLVKGKLKTKITLWTLLTGLLLTSSYIIYELVTTLLFLL